MIYQLYSAAVGRFITMKEVQISSVNSRSFDGLNQLGAQHAYERGSVAMIVPALVLLPHELHVRKYGIVLTIIMPMHNKFGNTLLLNSP